VRCSSGTYVRTLAHDIGARLEVGAHLSALRRTAVGHFNLEQALTLDDLDREARQGGLGNLLVGPSEMLAHLPFIRLDENRTSRLANGREIQLSLEEFGSIGSDSPVRLLDESGNLVAVGDIDTRLGIVKPRVVLAAEK